MWNRTTTAAKLLSFLELALKPASYAGLGSESEGARTDIVDVLSQRHWVETLVVALGKLVSLSVRPSLHYDTQLTTSAAKEEAPTPTAHHASTHGAARFVSIINLKLCDSTHHASASSPCITPIIADPVSHPPLTALATFHRTPPRRRCRSLALVTR